MKVIYTALLIQLTILFSACNKVQDKPTVYQPISYHIYQKTVINRQYAYPATYDTTTEDYNVNVKFCSDSLVWDNGDLFYRVNWDTTRVLYSHYLGYPFFVQFYNNRKEVEWRFENGAGTRYSQTISYWGHQL